MSILLNVLNSFYLDYLMNRNAKEQHLFEIEIICNNVNLYCHFSSSLLNKNINLIKKNLLTSNL